jgi:TonB-dependent receptor
LESINTYKTFTPDQPGDFTGGSVDIRTKTFPDKPSFGTGVTMEYNSQTTFNPNFLTYNGGGTGPFGGKANGRTIPQSVINTPTPPPFSLTGGDPQKLAAADNVNSAMRQMTPVVGLTNKTPPPNMSFNLQGGDFVEFGPEEKVGVIGVFSYRNKYSYFDNGQRYNLALEEKLVPGTTNTVLAVDTNNVSQSQILGKQELLWGGLTGLSGQWDKNNKASLNLMYSLGADDNASIRQNPENDYEKFQNIIDYGERTLAYLQLLGDHEIPEARNLKVQWNGGLGQATLNEPDQRQFTYGLKDGTYYDLADQEINPSGITPEDLTNETLQRFQRGLSEDSYYSIVDFIVPLLEEKERNDVFKTGFYADYSQRTYDQSSFNYPYGGFGSGIDPKHDGLYTYYEPQDGSTWADVFLNPDRSGLVDPTAGLNEPMTSYMLYNQNSEGSGTKAGTFYNASQAITASYLMIDFNLFPQLRLTGGARFENTNLKVKGSNDLPGILFDPEEYPQFVGGTGSGLAKIQQLDLLPGVGATFNLMENVNLRFAWSQTLARPSFKEMGPVLTKDFTDDQFFLGNPNLQLSKANNYDFRAEWFPRAGEVLAVSLFYKYLNQPMEQVTFNNPTYDLEYFQYQNASFGIVYGVEIEARKRLDQVASWLKNFSVYFNYSQIQSQVPLDEGTVALLKRNNQSTDDRPLQGQPEYIINAGLNYDNDEYRFYAGLFFNVTGPTLYSVGSPAEDLNGKPIGLLPDIYEMPAPSLDFNLTQGLTENWKLTFRGKNLLNPFFNRIQSFNGTEYLYSSFTKGWDVSLNASYSF